VYEFRKPDALEEGIPIIKPPKSLNIFFLISLGSVTHTETPNGALDIVRRVVAMSHALSDQIEGLAICTYI
jgi:hypothetical protein